MNEQLYTNCSILRDKAPVVLPIKLSIKVRGPDIYKQIVQRYGIITKSNTFPALILLRLLENAGGTTKLTNININNIKKILNMGIRQYINLYANIRSGQNATVSGSFFNDTLSPGRYVIEEQVNIRTDLIKDTKHVVIPRLMSYLQRIDDQNPGYGYQPVSEKTSAITELVRTLPERIVYQRERSENTKRENPRFRPDLPGLHNFTNYIQQEKSPFGRFNPHYIFIKNILEQKAGSKNAIILSKYHNQYHNPKSNVRAIGDTFQPVLAQIPQEKIQYQNSIRTKNTNLLKRYQDKDDNLLLADIDKAQANEIQIKKTGLFSGLQHLNMPDTPLFDEYTNPVTADVPGLEVSDNTKAKDMVWHPLIHIEKKIPEIDAIMASVQKRNKLVYEKHAAFHGRTANRYLLTEKNHIANKLISNTHIAGPGIMNAEAGGTPEIPGVLSHQDSILFQHAGHAQTGVSGPLNVSSNIIVRNPSGLVFRNPIVHNAGEGLENTGKPDIIKTQRTEINAENEDIIRTNIPARGSIDDIAIIAERVYKLLETRISIEKERRGL